MNKKQIPKNIIYAILIKSSLLRSQRYKGKFIDSILFTDYKKYSKVLKNKLQETANFLDMKFMELTPEEFLLDEIDNKGKKVEKTWIKEINNSSKPVLLFLNNISGKKKNLEDKLKIFINFSSIDNYQINTPTVLVLFDKNFSDDLKFSTLIYSLKEFEEINNQEESNYTKALANQLS